MALTSFMSSNQFSQQERKDLLGLARDSIEQGLAGRKYSVSLKDYSENLQALGASFVTLTNKGKLRGCIGILEAYQPLAEDVAEHSYAAAFQDPRFSPLVDADFPGIDIHISVLSVPEEMVFDSEKQLIEQIRPGADGLILKEGTNRGTFLPSVWESLPEPEEFLRHLKRKAGLDINHWSDSIKIYRYTTESIS